MNVCTVTSIANSSLLCKQSQWIQSAKRASFFLRCFMQICLIFMFIKLLEVDIPVATCIGVQPHPALTQLFPGLIHSFIFLYCPSSPPSLSTWQTEHYFSNSHICSNTWNQPCCLFKIQNLQEVGPRNLFFKIFTGDSYDQPQIITGNLMHLKETEADVLYMPVT